MIPQPLSVGADAELAVIAEWRENVNRLLAEIHRQTKETNGRVSELEIKERIRQDREEQKAIRDAASEAAKWRVETAAQEDREQEEKQHGSRITRRVMLIAAVLGGTPASLIEVIRFAVTGHI